MPIPVSALPLKLPKLEKTKQKPLPDRKALIERNPIVGFLRARDYKLFQSGENFVCSACPVAMHKKKGHRPVSIDVGKDVWYCNDHKVGGSVVDWVMYEKDVSVADAMRTLGGERNGSDLPSNKSTNRPVRRLIAATYDYTDGAGELLFQCVRYLPKDFRQRQPDGKGGWTWNLQGVPRVLYNLPQVISAQTVCVAEGERDCANLGELGFVATTNPLGAGKWREEYAETFRGKDVVVFGDNDQPDERGRLAGKEHAETVLASLIGKAKSLKHPQLPNGFHDISDYIESLKRDGLPKEAIAQAIRKLIEETSEVKPEPPRVEVQPQGDAEPVELPPPPEPYVSPPLDLFPAGVQRFVRAGAETFDVDTAFFTLPILSGAAATIGNARSIRLKEDYIEHPVIWTATIASTGAGKSPVEHAVNAPLRNRESELIRKNREAYAQYAKELAAWEAKPKKERAEKPQKPPLLTCLMDDTTIEAAAYRLNDNPRGIGLVKDELSHWFESFDQYHDRGGADVSRWLSLWTGNLFALDRVTGGARSSGRSYRIEAPRFSITGGVVPEVFKRLLTDDYFERGLPARFLFAMPPRNRPRKYVDRDIPKEIKAELHDLFAQLAALQADTSRDGEQRPKLLALSPEAKQLFKNFHNECASRAFDANPREAAQWSKLSAYSARLALVAEMMWDTKADVISGEVMRAACDLSRWFGDEAERIYALVGETDWQRDRRLLIEFIQRRGGEVTEKDIYNNLRRLKNKPKETADWLDQLVRNSLGKWETVPPTAKGGRPTRQFCLFEHHPSAKPSVLPSEAKGLAVADTRDTQEK